MSNKIAWYKEVLEVEPGSRVFLPLARLLFEEGRDQEAHAALLDGLSRHPEFIEARMLLVEVLSRMGRGGEAARHAAMVAERLEGYDGFWRTWAESEAREGRRDPALALRFLAAAFGGRELNWTEVIEQGLALVLGGEAASPEVASGAAAGVHGLELVGGHGKGPARSPVDDDLEADEDAGDDLPSSEDLLALAGQASQVMAGSPLAGPAPEEVSEDAAEALDDLDGLDHEADKTFEADEADEGEEVLSLRTRTMAELMVEQGDHQGALDILRELLESARGPEHTALEARIRELEAQAAQGGHAADRPEAEDKAAKAEAPLGQNKLMHTLEALAQRLEARAAG